MAHTSRALESSADFTRGGRAPAANHRAPERARSERVAEEQRRPDEWARANGRLRHEQKGHHIAGPNGAGKTTFARSFLPEEAQCQRFINADLIAAGLSPFAPEAAALKAGRLMLEEIAACVRKGESFAFETRLLATSIWAALSNGGNRAIV